MIWIKRIFKTIAFLILSCVFFLLLLFRRDIPSDEAEMKYQTAQSHFVEVDGVNLHVRFMGDGDPIVLLHGSFSSLHTWEEWQKALSPYFLTISIDLPGHGLTGPDPDKRYSTRDYSQLVIRLMEKLNLERYHLAGNSMGGSVALQIASTRPDRVMSLNLIDASGAPRLTSRNLDDPSEKSSSGADAWIFKLARNPVFSKLLLKCTPKFLFAINMRQVYGDDSKISPETLDRYYELMLREGNRKAFLDRLTTPKDLDVDFSRLTMPTLILWGELDTWIPVSQGYLLEKAIPASNLVIFPGVGHVPMEEIPTESVAEYLSFLGVEIRKNYLTAPNYVTYVE